MSGQLNRVSRVGLSEALTVRSEDNAITMTFDLANVEMSDEQAVIVRKLFGQHPDALVATTEHRHARERGKPGPGARYLPFEEFEAIRELGVRLGTDGDLVALVCDFCLHCVKLEATPTWRGGFVEATG
jgi:hypothetical protein